MGIETKLVASSRQTGISGPGPISHACMILVAALAAPPGREEEERIREPTADSPPIIFRDLPDIGEEASMYMGA